MPLPEQQADTFVRRETPGASLAREREGGLSAGAIRLLLVEDQPEYALLLRRNLARARNARFAVQHAERLSTATELLSHSEFDAIVLDLTLPDSAELATLEAVLAAAPQTPVIVLSGLEDEAIALRAVQGGAQDYLVKDKVSVDLLERAILYALERKRSQDALFREQYLLRTLMENMPDSIYFKDEQSRFTRINRGLAEHLGLGDPAEAVGKSDFDYFSPEHAAQAFADEQKVMETGDPVIALEERETWPDGRVGWVSTTKMPLRDQRGRIIGTFGISRDITAQKLAEAEIRLLNEELEGRVLERTSELFEANRELENEIEERQRTEDALRTSNKRFTALFESALDAILISDDSGRYIDANPAAAQLFDLPRESLIGLSIVDMIDAGARRTLDQWWAGFVLQGQFKGEFKLVLPNSATKSVELNASANFLPGQHLSVMRDVTERSRIEEERARSLLREQAQSQQLRRLARASLAINSAISRQGLLQVITEQARELVGSDQAYTCLVPDEGKVEMISVIAKTPNHAPPEGSDLDQTTREIYERVIASGGPMSFSTEELEDICPGARGMLAAPLLGRDGRGLGAIYLVDKEEGDFSLEDAALLMQLGFVAAVAFENSRLYRETQDAVRAREEVLTIVSHDLKNPLGVIQGNAQLLRRRLQPNTPENRLLTRTLTQIEGAARRMNKQIEELLDFARLQAGQPLELNREQLDLVGLTRRLVSEHGRTTESHVLRVQSAVPELVGMWDQNRLERMLDNLLSNAIKYTPKGGDIILTLNQEQSDGEQVAVLTVKDAGLGIPAADLPYIFQRFHRASNVAGSIPGTGIGLASTKQIVEQHGGSIAVASKEGEGTTFTVRLPMMAVAATAV